MSVDEKIIGLRRHEDEPGKKTEKLLGSQEKSQKSVKNWKSSKDGVSSWKK